MSEQRAPCKFGSSCYQTSKDHRRAYAHLGDPDYALAMRLHGFGCKPEFNTIRHLFLWSDPFNSGFIDDHKLLRELFFALGSPLKEGESEKIYEALDADGNGEVGFPEFAEWCLKNMYELVGREFPLGLDDAMDTHVLIPEHWEFRPGVNTNDDERHELYAVNTDEFAVLANLLHNTYRGTWTRDRGRGEQVPGGYELVSARRNENPRVWTKYNVRRKLVENRCKHNKPEQRPLKTTYCMSKLPCGMPLSHICNEWFTFHGTNQDTMMKIMAGDFLVRTAGSTTGTLYGNGIYMAESITKADEYAKEDGDGLFRAILCRVIGGAVLYNDEVDPNGDELRSKAIYGSYDSVIGDREKARGTYKEIVVYDADQVYPAYELVYKRLQNEEDRSYLPKLPNPSDPCATGCGMDVDRLQGSYKHCCKACMVSQGLYHDSTCGMQKLEEITNLGFGQSAK